MLQRARSSAAMFLEAVRATEYDSGIRIDTRLVALREMMLSLEFTTATADLDLDAAYRALEAIQIKAERQIVQVSVIEEQAEILVNTIASQQKRLRRTFFADLQDDIDKDQARRRRRT
jgi:hypothetical protein